MSFLNRTHTSIIVNASAASLAWVNAFHASGQNADRGKLFRTLSVEIFKGGVQFIATDGTLLFRTWVPVAPKGGKPAAWPSETARPVSAVVVRDTQNFALSFVKALGVAATSFEVAEVCITVEGAPAKFDDEQPLGDSLSEDVLTLRAFGQVIHCPLLEDQYPNWRTLDFGISQAERVDGTTVATKKLSIVGKLKGVKSIDLTFTGETKQIVLSGSDDSLRGLLMPMERNEPKRETVDDEDDDQIDIEDGTISETSQVKVNGRWMPATRVNMAKAVSQAMRSGRKAETRKTQ